MTRIAFVSDMHGNLVALEAALKELERRGPFDAVLGGGDYCLSGAYPAECVARVRESGWIGLRGNTDEWIVDAATGGRVPVRDCPPEFAHNETQRAADAWCAARLADDAVAWLAELPLDWRTTGPSGQTLTCLHATPWNTHVVVRRTFDDADKLRLLDGADTDVLIYGHVHDAYTQRFGERTLACAGSVGAPMDGDTRGVLLIAEDDGAGWRLEHVRVPYDQDGYIATLLACGQPGVDAFARKLRAASFDA
jgi:predicted phosphodiesterase